MNNQEILFQTRASHSADATDAQLGNLCLAAELGATLFRTTLPEPGTDVEVTIDGSTVTYPASRDEDAGPATDRALQECERAKNRTFLPPPAVLFSQLVEGDEESFNLALLDALEAHRDHHQVAARATDSDAAINLDILALTCHRAFSRRPNRSSAAALGFFQSSVLPDRMGVRVSGSRACRGSRCRR
ncbi:Imm49 family immunity protein [Streptomyces sp. NPDC127197]|uniref:Imm49 family immunity protein n=1 Tax=Streptomyces sp. NPDC127197 TaxID=3345388 RepID=UPI00362B7B81